MSSGSTGSSTNRIKENMTFGQFQVISFQYFRITGEDLAFGISLDVKVYKIVFRAFRGPPQGFRLVSILQERKKRGNASHREPITMKYLSPHDRVVGVQWHVVRSLRISFAAIKTSIKKNDYNSRIRPHRKLDQGNLPVYNKHTGERYKKNLEKIIVRISFKCVGEWLPLNKKKKGERAAYSDCISKDYQQAISWLSVTAPSGHVEAIR